MERRLTSDKLDVFCNEYRLPCKLLLCLVKTMAYSTSSTRGQEALHFSRPMATKRPIETYWARLWRMHKAAGPGIHSAQREASPSATWCGSGVLKLQRKLVPVKAP
ncbi:hypothetical protein EJB05_50198, partial [Eragrostis curvula]